MHRRRHHHAPQQPPSAAALLAATTAYHPPSLAAAAAGAALRASSTSSAPPAPRPGTIPTKRMLQRRASYSSASDTPQRSLSSRRFRSPSAPARPSAPTPRAATARWNDSSSSSSDDDDDWSLRRITSARSFPTTMRGAVTTTTTTPRRRWRRRASDPEVVAVTAAVRRAPVAESIKSTTASELESIAEDAPLRIADADSGSDPEDTFELVLNRTLAPAAAARHTPPPRSVSPAKSALRHVPSARKPRVSFSDEDSVASFSAYVRPQPAGPDAVRAPPPPPPLPVFVRTDRGAEVTLTLTPATPCDEAPPPLPSPPQQIPPGGFPAGDTGDDSDSDSDSDSGESIYSDAYEALPAPEPAPVVPNAPAIVLRPAAPVPPDRSTQYPSPASSHTDLDTSSDDDDDDDSIRSASSFRRISPRRPRAGITMLRSLRVPAVPASSGSGKLGKSSAPFRSRFADDSDSDDDDVVPAAKLQRRHTTSDAGAAPGAQFWRGVFKRPRHTTTAAAAAEEASAEATAAPDVCARKKRFTRLRRLLRLG